MDCLYPVREHLVFVSVVCMEIIKIIYGIKGACFQRDKRDCGLSPELRLGASMC